MFIKVVDTVITQEIEPKQVKTLKENDVNTTDRDVFSEVKQSKYDVLYGYPLQRPPGERKWRILWGYSEIPIFEEIT